MPERQRADHQGVDAGELPPPCRKEPPRTTAVDAVDPVQCVQRDDGRECRHDHREQFEKCGAGREPGVDVHVGGQSGGRCALQVGEDADNLWAVVTGQGGADAVDSGDRRDGLLGVGRDGDRRAPAQLIERGRDQYRIAGECFEAVGSGADGEAAGVSVRRPVRHGREQCAAAAAQLAEGGTGDADVERCGRVGDQRRRDAVDGPTLRPVDARGFLLDGQERRRECKKQAKKAGDYRDESCRPDSLGIRFSGSFGASGHGFRGHYYFRRHKERC